MHGSGAEEEEEGKEACSGASKVVAASRAKGAEVVRWEEREKASRPRGEPFVVKGIGLCVGEPATLLRQRLQGQFPQQRGQDHVVLLNTASQSSFMSSMHCLHTIFMHVLQGAKSRFDVLSDVWHTWQQVQRVVVVAMLSVGAIWVLGWACGEARRNDVGRFGTKRGSEVAR